jgi:hypothetical protein
VQCATIVVRKGKRIVVGNLHTDTEGTATVRLSRPCGTVLTVTVLAPLATPSPSVPTSFSSDLCDGRRRSGCVDWGGGGCSVVVDVHSLRLVRCCPCTRPSLAPLPCFSCMIRMQPVRVQRQRVGHRVGAERSGVLLSGRVSGVCSCRCRWIGNHWRGCDWQQLECAIELRVAVGERLSVCLADQAEAEAKGANRIGFCEEPQRGDRARRSATSEVSLALHSRGERAARRKQQPRLGELRCVVTSCCCSRSRPAASARIRRSDVGAQRQRVRLVERAGNEQEDEQNSSNHVRKVCVRETGCARQRECICGSSNEEQSHLWTKVPWMRDFEPLVPHAHLKM